MRIICSICKEIIPFSENKVTSCGHIYHSTCITRWYSEKKTCPQCRSVIKYQPVKVYFDVEKSEEKDASTLEYQLDVLTDKLQEQEDLYRKLKEENATYERLLEELKESAKSYKERNGVLKTVVQTLKDEVSKLTKKNEALGQLEQERDMWKNKVNSLDRVDYLLKCSSDEIKCLIKSTPVTSQAVRQLCTYVGVLKLQLSKSQSKYESLLKENKDLSKSLAEEKYKNTYESEETIKTLKDSIGTLQKELVTAKNLLKEEKRKIIEKNVVKEDKNPIPDKKAKKQITSTKIDLMDVSILDEEVEEKPKKKKVVEDNVSDSLKKWEELVIAGHSRNFGITFNKHRPYTSNSGLDDEELKSLSSKYAFDGLGGRKKIRLGSPTPREEFLKIKKKKLKSMVKAPSKKIIDYYQIY